MSSEVAAPAGEIVEQEIPGVGLLRFENQGPGEWQTQKGEPAKKARRRYLLGEEEFDSVSSIVDTLSKPALLRWYEDHGARGAARLARDGELDDVPEEEIVDRVRAARQGAEAVAREGADRGTAIHDAFHRLAETGEPPNPMDFPGPFRPWVQGAVRAWLALDPEPIRAEFLVCHPEHMYAGRPDLYALCDGRRTLIDYKTGKGRVFPEAHFQTRGYAECFEACGLEPPERIVIVGIDDNGGFELVDCEADRLDWLALVHTFRARKRINAGMAAQRRAARKAAEAVVA